jgi:hypothetical protein
MGYQVSTITGFIDSLSNMKLHTAATFGNRTPQLVDVRMNIKYKEAVHKLDTTAYAQVGGCSFTASGDSTLTDAVLEVKPVAWNTQWCPNTLENTFAGKMLPNGSIYSEDAAIQEVIDDYNRKVASLVETMDWQGNIASGNPNLSKYNGIHTIITAAGGTIAPVGSGSLAMNETNIRTALRACLVAVPDVYKGDSSFFFVCNPSIYQTYLNKLASDNLYQKPFTDGNGYVSVAIENSVHNLLPVNGLSGVNVIYGYVKDNIIMGCDETQTGEDNIGGTELWYSKDDRVIKYTVQHKRGFVCVRTAQVVRYAFT